jgi:spermidine synthase
MDVVNALNRGVSQVVGVEINRRIIELVSDRFAEFSGGAYRDARVRIVHSDGRNFVEWTPERFDLIQLTLVDTFAAISSGALSRSRRTSSTPPRRSAPTSGCSTTTVCSPSAGPSRT